MVIAFSVFNAMVSAARVFNDNDALIGTTRTGVFNDAL